MKLLPLILFPALFSSIISAQASLSLSFRDHDGTVSPLTNLLPGRTGNFEGQLTLETDLVILDYIWAYYYNGSIWTEPAGNPSADYYSFSRKAAKLPFFVRDGDGEYTFSVSLPLGYGSDHAAFPGLPFGGLELRLWIGEEGVLTDNGSQPPTGSLAMLVAPLTLQNPHFIVFVSNSRTLPAATSVTARVVSSSTVSQDTYFELHGFGIASPAVTLIVINENEHTSEPFEVQLDEFPGEGEIHAIRIDSGSSTIHRSPFLKTRSLVEELDDDTGPESWIEPHKYCASVTRPYTGGQRRFCGECIEGGSAQYPPHPTCTLLANGPKALGHNFKCKDNPTTDCVIERATITVPVFQIDETNLVLCGTIAYKGTTSTSIGIVGADQSMEVVKHLLQECCIIKFIENKTVRVKTCQQ